MSKPLTKEVIEQQLQTITLPDGSGDIVSAGMVSDIFIKDGSVMFSLTVPAEKADTMEPLRKRAEDLVKAMDGVAKVMVALTAERKPGSGGPSPAPQRRPAQPQRQQGAAPAKLEVKGVKHIIAVYSAKGGVGKSTTAVNLALAFQANGLKVGILDADVYGPSIPRLLGITDRPETYPGTRLLKPLKAHGLTAMSIGLLIEEDTPMVWRGPMVVSALTQMLRDVAWDMDGELDVLVVDMPPGTGDIQLTMAQQVPLSGAVMISTPQDLALIDVRKGIAMFRKVSIPILGLIENMSFFMCPDCGAKHDIFGHGGARTTAVDINVPFLGEVPLHMDIRERSDSGEPIVAAEPDGDFGLIYRAIASTVSQSLEGAVRPAPRIIIE
ncbi:iron-sulfur cluster carrier protein ApbC [uncultured Cohaesibacter sp.]|uniref:iron-sulfur cluster carrier protein ApbC n=1 Tax=uncultured Cohaesibacter sp. TaxID=1002546 RepID=UPI0029C799A9|nr:iron-sulfur cluster carrier protein ApbC [uncultured Cohaesibacter sp.]